MEIAQQWLDAQRGTPSFVANRFGVVDAAGGPSDSILDQPLPAGLANVSLDRTGAQAVAARRADRATLAAGGRNIHEELLAKGKLYAQQKEARQEKAALDELRTLRAPKISDEAKKRSQHEPFHTRIARLEAQRQEQREHRLQQVRKNDEEKLNQVNTFKPRLSARGRRATGKVHLMMAEQHDHWQSRRDEQIESERARRVVQELQEVRDGPTINARSQRLAAKKRERDGLDGLAHAEAMLERDRLTKLAIWEKQQRDALEADNPNPRITMYAATMDRGEEGVGDRLYKNAFDAAARKAEMARESFDATHRPPRISATARSRSRSQRIEDDLMERHLQSLAEKERAQLDQERRTRQQHTPAINPVSDAIAAQLPLSSMARLVQPRSTSHADPASGISAVSAPRDGHGRSMSAISAAMTEESRQQVLQRQEERRLRRLAEMRDEAAEREMAECTFAPATSPGTSRRRAATPTASLVERTMQWQKKHEQWRADEQLKKREAETDGCTFQPERLTGPPRSVTPHRTIYGGEGRAWGTDEFIARQRAARERHREEELRQVQTGARWQNRSTVPIEPTLGRVERAAPVRSLDQPWKRLGLADDRWETPSEEASADRREPQPAATAGYPVHPRGELLVPFSVHEHRAAVNAMPQPP